MFHIQTLTGAPAGPGGPWGPISPGSPWKERIEKCWWGCLDIKSDDIILNSAVALTSKPGRAGGPLIPGRPSSPCTCNS